MSDEPDLVEWATDALYAHLDAYGATNRVAYLIRSLIEEVVAAEVNVRFIDLERRLDEIESDARIRRQMGL